MDIMLNGKIQAVDDDITVQSLIESLPLKNRALVVELNEAVLDKTCFATTKLAQSDKIEILQFVGGG